MHQRVKGVFKMDYMIIAINKDCSNVFSDFANQYPEFALPVEHEAFIGSDQIMEFIITLGPATLSALAAYFVARVQNTKKEIRIKKQDLEIEIKGYNITPEEVMDTLLKLEQKDKDEQ